MGIYGFVVTPMVEEFGASDAQVGAGMSILVLAMSVASPVLGPILDRGRIRATMLAGVAVMLACAWLLSRTAALWQLAAAFAGVSLGLAMYGHLPVTVLLCNWFVERRGTAIAVAAMGMSAAGLFVPPLSAWLVRSFGWRDAVALLATGAAVVAFPAIAGGVVRRPEDVGQRPDGRAPGSGTGSGPEGGGALLGEPPERSARELLRERNFWLVGVGLALAMCVPISSLFFVRHMEGLGVAPERASLLIAAMSVLSVLGKLTSGLLADRLDKRAITLSVLALYAAGWILLATAESLGALLWACLPLGFGGGALIPLPGILVGACFGRAVVGRVAGLHAPLGLPFLLAAAPVVGLARDATGGFATPFLGLAGVLGAAIAVLSFVRIPPREPGDFTEVETVPRGAPL